MCAVCASGFVRAELRCVGLCGVEAHIHTLQNAVPDERLEDVAVARERRAVRADSSAFAAGLDEQLPGGTAVRAEPRRHEDRLAKDTHVARRRGWGCIACRCAYS